MNYPYKPRLYKPMDDNNGYSMPAGSQVSDLKLKIING